MGLKSGDISSGCDLMLCPVLPWQCHSTLTLEGASWCVDRDRLKYSAGTRNLHERQRVRANGNLIADVIICIL